MPRNGESGTVSDSENLSVTPGDHGKGMAGLIFKLATKIEEDIRGFSLICPLNIGIGMTPAYVEAIVVNASEEGFLIESPRDIPVGTELSITVLYLKGLELANFKFTGKIVWKEPYSKEDWKGNPIWKGYQYGLELIQILDEDHWKLSFHLSGRFEIKEISSSLCRQLY